MQRIDLHTSPTYVGALGYLTYEDFEGFVYVRLDEESLQIYGVGDNSGESSMTVHPMDEEIIVSAGALSVIYYPDQSFVVSYQDGIYNEFYCSAFNAQVKTASQGKSKNKMLFVAH